MSAMADGRGAVGEQSAECRRLRRHLQPGCRHDEGDGQAWITDPQSGMGRMLQEKSKNAFGSDQTRMHEEGRTRS